MHQRDEKLTSVEDFSDVRVLIVTDDNSSQHKHGKTLAKWGMICKCTDNSAVCRKALHYYADAFGTTVRWRTKSRIGHLGLFDQIGF